MIRLKLLNPILISDFISLCLVFIVFSIPSTTVRSLFAALFLLLPGYVLDKALFVAQKHPRGFERAALIIGFSIVANALIGFALNYTSWGITVESITLAITSFIVILSFIAIWRNRNTEQSGLTFEFTISIPGWGGSALNRSFSLALVIAFIGAFALLGYTVIFPKTGEKFTEFYIMGVQQKAQEYPSDFVLRQGKVVEVIYNTGWIDDMNGMGRINIAMVNHEQQTMDYFIQMHLDGIPAEMWRNGPLSLLGPIKLAPGQGWEQQVGIIPQRAGDSQKVEVLLFKNSNTIPTDRLIIWINVKEVS